MNRAIAEVWGDVRTLGHLLTHLAQSALDPKDRLSTRHCLVCTVAGEIAWVAYIYVAVVLFEVAVISGR